MKYIEKITFFVLILLCAFTSFSQTCDRTAIIEICDMSIIDSDNSDGSNIPDGILDLYDEYQSQFPAAPALQNGAWEIVDQRFRASLDSNTGILKLWDLPRSSETEDDYVFRLTNTECGSTTALTLKLILGAFSGVAREISPNNDVSIEICDAEELNLNTTLLNDVPNGIPPGHLNGEWLYRGTSPNVTSVSNSNYSFDIPYDSSEAFNQEIFEFTYIVPGFTPCSPEQETTVKVSVTRQVFAGESDDEGFAICEEEIEAGVYDADINLFDDLYLVDEDLGGNWVPEPTGEIDSPTDSFINLRNVYDDMIVREGLRFGCQTFSYQHEVQKRSVVCTEDMAFVTFVIFEKLRPFSQPNPLPEFCANVPRTINLFDYIEFTTEQGILFEYKSDFFKLTDWNLVSTTAAIKTDLGLVSQEEAQTDPNLVYTANGTIQIDNSSPGTYVFRYDVSATINCTLSETSPCPDLSTEVTIIINPVEYAGEDTFGLEVCESEETIDLRSLLNTNGTSVATTGVWTSADGMIVPNEFIIPTLTSDPQNFGFTYTTTTDKGCVETASLTFRVFEEPVAGTPSDATICREQGTFELFTLLSDADETGFWIGPVGYNSKVDTSFDEHIGYLDLSQSWQSGTYTYTVPNNGACVATPPKTASIELTIIENIPAIEDTSGTFCKEEGQINLFELLPNNANIGGIFTNDSTAEVLTDGAFVFENLPGDIYNFTYTVSNGACSGETANVGVRIIEVQQPDSVSPTEFCILEAAILADVDTVEYIAADGSRTPINNFIWYTTPDGDETVAENTLLEDGQTLYLAAVGDTGCESIRLEVVLSVLNLGEIGCTLEFQDGVSPNTPGDNDTFNITQWRDQDFNIPTIFETFELQIFNRYGTLVYEANQNTEEFRGVSNAGIQLGKDLPSGVYFYILNPNKNENRPIQGNFYLSK